MRGCECERERGGESKRMRSMCFVRGVTCSEIGQQALFKCMLIILYFGTKMLSCISFYSIINFISMSQTRTPCSTHPTSHCIKAQILSDTCSVTTERGGTAAKSYLAILKERLSAGKYFPP